jgi:hypothetical protein
MVTPQWRRPRNEHRVHLRESQVERAAVNGNDIEQDKACIVHKSGNLGEFWPIVHCGDQTCLYDQAIDLF